MKKIFGIVLALVLLVSVLAVLPAAAANEENGVYLHLDDGITFVYVYEGVETPKHIAAKEIGDLQDFQNLGSYSVQSYLKELIAGEYSQTTKNIAQAVLNYGAAAYDFFNYEGTAIDGTPVTDTSALMGADAPNVVIEDTNGIYLGATLVLDGDMKLRFYFVGNDVEVNYEDNDLDATVKDENCSYFDVPVMPYDMDKSVVVTVGTTKVKYAPINYLKAKAADESLSAMVASIYAYGVAAEAYIEEVCEHADIKLDVIKPATLFTTGITNNVCELCGRVVDTDVTTGAPVTEHYTDEEHGLFGEKVELSTVLGDGEHFYGEDAKKLYVEFSILWNPSLLNYARENNENYMYMGMFAGDNAETNRKTSFHLAFANDCPGFWCKHIGGFEPDNNKSTVYGDYTYPGKDGKVTDFPNIGNYGWHRIGYEFEQTTNLETGKHYVTVYLYIDGVKVSGYNVVNGVDNSNANLLYTADVVDGELVYTGDVKSGTYMWAFAFANGGKADGDMYFTYADVFVTAGDGFVMPVEKVSNPKYATFSPAAGVTFNASTYFKPIGDDNCAHENTAAGVTTTAPTLFANGAAAVICTDCGKTVDGSITLPKIDGVAVETFTPGANVQDIFGAKVNIVNDVLKGDHFYPTEENPNGKSMYVEFSLLWNETLKNVENGKDRYVQFGTLGDETASSDGKRITPFFLVFNQTKDADDPFWCQYHGGFETDNNKTNIVGPKVESNLPADGYTYIGEYGWHRIGVKYTQTHEVATDGSVEYTLYTSLYIDGVEKLTYKAIYSKHNGANGNIGSKGTQNLLYTYDVNTGEYTDIASDRYVYAYRFGISHESVDEAAYFVVKDASVTCGTDFVMNVAPNADPEDATFTKDGITLPGKQHFDEIVIDCENGIHVWANEPTVDVAPTCTTEGSKSVKCLACGASDTTTVETIDALGHAWDTKYTVDVPVTCVTDGEESIKCTVCSATKPESSRVIVSAGQHVWAEGYTVVTVPTVFAEGYRTGTCTECNEAIDGPIDKTEMTLHTYTYTGTGTAEPHYKTGNIGEALGDKTFKPGNDLYLEFSVLLNNTTDNLSGEAFGFGHIAKKENPNAEGAIWDNFSWFHYKAQLRWCNFKGGFDFSEVDKFTYGPVYRESGAADDIVALETYDGWHRMGLQYTQNVYENNGSFTYDVTVTVYLDGVMVSETVMNWDALFYSAKREGSEIVYTQNPDIADYYVVFYNIASGYVKNEGETAYFPFGDFSLSVGDSFAMPVAPVENPESVTFTPAEGADPMDVTVHFEHRYQKDCDAGNHTYTGKYTIDSAPACGVDGQKSYKCEVCGEVKTEVIPSEQHVWNKGNDTEITDITVATFFSKGVQKGTCRDCGEFDYAPIEKRTATLKTFTNKTSGSFYEREKLSDVVVGGQDLFVEFSMLFNDSFKKYNGNGAIYLAMIAKNDGSSKKTPYFLTLKSRSDFVCKFFGGFESDNNSNSVYIYGPDYATEFPSIADEYGWHRIGLRYHQEAVKDSNGNVTYTLSVYLYIDGEYISAFKLFNGVASEERLLYTVTEFDSNGNPTKYKVNENMYIYAFWFDNIKSSGGSMYFAYADVHITAGPAADNYTEAEMEKYEGFVVPVESVESPESKEGYVGGQKLPTTEYFKVKSN